MAYDADGELEKFSASYRKKSGATWYVGTVAWRATVPPQLPTYPPDAAADPLSVETDRATYDAGDTAQVTVTVPNGPFALVDLYTDQAMGPARFLGTRRADAVGQLRFEERVDARTVFYAASGAHAGSAVADVEEPPAVEARVVARGYGHLRRQGQFLLFRAGRPAKFAAAATPVYGEECLYVQAQRRRNNGWRTLAIGDPCLRIEEGAVVTTRVEGGAGVRKRVRFVLAAVGGRPAAASDWLYVRFVR